MNRKYIALALVGLLVQALMARPVFARPQGNTETQAIEKIKKKLTKIGVGDRARVTVKYKDGTKLKGYVYQVGENDFVVRDRKTDAATNVFYKDVAKVEDNRGHSTAKAIAIGIGVGAGAFLTLLAIAFAVVDD